MSGSVLDLSPEEREKLVSEVLNDLKKIGCECIVEKCPFKGICYLCIRNHRADGTLPACCLPHVSDRFHIDKYPDCRTPLLWFLISPETFKELFYKLQSDELREKIKMGLARLYFTARSL